MLTFYKREVKFNDQMQINCKETLFTYENGERELSNNFFLKKVDIQLQVAPNSSTIRVQNF